MTYEQKARMYKVIAWCIAFVWLGIEFMKGVIR